MRKANPRCTLLLLMSLLAAEGTAASSSSSNPSSRPDVTAFTFQRQSDPETENDASTKNPSSKPKPHACDSSAVSSLLFDGGCEVSAQAIMCTGGEAYFDVYPEFDYDEEQGAESEDDDDDDDDDGHSSMLSNASLRRSKVGVGGYHQRQPSQRESPSSSSDRESDIAMGPPTASTGPSMAFVGGRRRMFGLR